MAKPPRVPLSPRSIHGFFWLPRAGRPRRRWGWLFWARRAITGGCSRPVVLPGGQWGVLKHPPATPSVSLMGNEGLGLG